LTSTSLNHRKNFIECVAVLLALVPALSFFFTATYELGFATALRLPFGDLVSPSDIFQRSFSYMLPATILIMIGVAVGALPLSADRQKFSQKEFSFILKTNIRVSQFFYVTIASAYLLFGVAKNAFLFFAIPIFVWDVVSFTVQKCFRLFNVSQEALEILRKTIASIIVGVSWLFLFGYNSGLEAAKNDFARFTAIENHGMQNSDRLVRNYYHGVLIWHTKPEQLVFEFNSNDKRLLVDYRLFDFDGFLCQNFDFC